MHLDSYCVCTINEALATAASYCVCMNCVHDCNHYRVYPRHYSAFELIVGNHSTCSYLAATHVLQTKVVAVRIFLPTSNSQTGQGAQFQV